MGNSLINDIIAPELSQSGYGAGIKNVFEQIDANFKILGNQDFVKGDQGWSIGHNELYITYTKNNATYFTKEGIDVLNAIIKEITDQQYEYQDDVLEHQNIKTVKTWLDTIDALKSVNKVVDDKTINVSLIDSIVPGDLFNEIYVYDPTKPDDSYTIGATNDYVFKDRRFVVEMDHYDEAYSSLYDCSGTVHLQVYEEVDPDTGIKTLAKKFVVIQNAPTLYFDTNVQAFCWRIGGQNTGLIAQGPKGDSGQSATFYIVELGDPKNPIPDAPAAGAAPATSYTKKVTRYMDINGGWVNLADQPAPADFDKANCIAFEPTEINGDETPTSYFGKIVKGANETFIVSCTNDNRIQTNLNLNWLAATFASIRTTKALKGLFVPIESPGIGSSYDTAPVHAIWHAPIGSYNSIFSELHVSPMATYAGIDTVANGLRDLPAGSKSRLSSYNSDIYTSSELGNSISLVFDYNNVIFAGHNSGANGVRIGIGTNNIFTDSVGTNSLVRFSANSKVDMPGTSHLGVNEISTSHIFADNNDISLSCKNLNISGKEVGEDPLVYIAGALTVTGSTLLGTTIINGGATITGRTTIDDHLDVNGHTKITGGATINGVKTITSDGATTITSELLGEGSSQIKVEIGQVTPQVTLTSSQSVHGSGARSSVEITPNKVNINSDILNITGGMLYKSIYLAKKSWNSYVGDDDDKDKWISDTGADAEIDGKRVYSIKKSVNVLMVNKPKTATNYYIFAFDKDLPNMTVLIYNIEDEANHGMYVLTAANKVVKVDPGKPWIVQLSGYEGNYKKVVYPSTNVTFEKELDDR